MINPSNTPYPAPFRCEFRGLPGTGSLPGHRWTPPDARVLTLGQSRHRVAHDRCGQHPGSNQGAALSADQTCCRPVDHTGYQHCGHGTGAPWGSGDDRGLPPGQVWPQLPDSWVYCAGRALHVQCAYSDPTVVKIVTVYEPDPARWTDMRIRRRE